MSLKDELEAANKLDPVEIAGASNMTMFNKSSGPRLHLTSTYLEQSLILNESEVPMIYTGFEKELGSYNDSLKVAKVPYKILHKIDKFPSFPNHHYSLVVQDMETGVISLIENKRYENLAEEHGYFKPFIETDYKGPGNIIEKGSVISRANSHDEYFNYKYGVNANVAYISKKDNIEDGIIISESFSKRVSYTTVKVVEVTLGFNDILLNIYGDSVIYKSFPDIFGKVKDGMFCVKRSIDHLNVGCNTTVNSLMTIDTNDEIFHGDGELIDIEIFVNSNPELVKDNGHRRQIVTYYNIVKDYKFRVMKALEPYIKDPVTNVTAEANTRYYNYKNYIDTCLSPNNDIRFANSIGTFEFAFMKFTIARSVNIYEGAKLTNRFGGKGVVCTVVPDVLMPVDEYGTVAEVILNPCGVIGRSNPGQLYEQELNFIAHRVCAMIAEEESFVKKYILLNTFLTMTDEDSAKKFDAYYKALSVHHKHEKLNEIATHGIYIHQHPFTNITFEQLKQLYIKFNIKPSRVTVGVKGPNGTIHKYMSKNSVIIAKAYILVLKHTTDSKFSSVSISDVNSLGLPSKNTSKSKNLPFRNTPIKLGEMEVNIAINRIEPLKVNRLMAGNGSNLRHRDRVSKMLLEQDPFMYHDVPIKDEDIMDSIASDAFVAIMHQLGYVIFSDTSEIELSIGSKE